MIHIKIAVKFRVSAQLPLGAMCERLPAGKGFSEGDARLVGAAMCAACGCGAFLWPLAIMLFARSGPGQKHAVKSCGGTSGVSDLRIDRLGALLFH